MNLRALARALRESIDARLPVTVDALRALRGRLRHLCVRRLQGELTLS